MKKLSRNENIGVGVALLVTFGFLFFGSYIFGSAPSSATKNVQATNVAGVDSGSTLTSSGLITQDISVGNGDAVKSGDKISVNYIGMLTDGSKFDSSYDRGQPIEFTVGSGQLIKGFDEGVIGMKVGGKRKLTIPPELGYGSQQVGSIAPNSTIVFQVELMKIGQ